MTVIYIVLPLALVIVGVAVWAFVWAADRGQFDDLDTPAVRLLHDDQPPVTRRRPTRRTRSLEAGPQQDRVGEDG